MLTLIDLQNEMRSAILAEPGRDLLDEIVSDRIPAQERLQVYRDHFRTSLGDGLGRVFYATRILLGERYFDALTGLFIASRPPNDPRVCEYGDAFPRFLVARGELEDFPFAIDVARLEWALTRIENAPDTPTPDIDAIRRAVMFHGGDVVLCLSRASTLFESRWPVHRIRASVLAGGGAETVAPLLDDATPARLLLHRDLDGDACELVLDEASYAALRALYARRTVADAVRAASVVAAGCPVAELIAFLLETGLVAGVEPIHAPRRGAALEN